VSPTGNYRIGGHGVRASEPFHLPPQGKVTLVVDPGKGGSKTGPIVLLVVGGIGLAPVVGVSAVVGIVELLGALFVCPFVSAFASKANQNSAYGQCLSDGGAPFTALYGEPYVWIPAVAGGALIVGGFIWLVAASGHPTHVDKSVAVLPPAQPRWELPAHPIALPAPAVTPLLTVHF
jgi:hypothetical protein